MGKSSLAAKYAFLCKHLYSDGVLYFNAESWATLTNSVINNVNTLTHITGSSLSTMNTFPVYSSQFCL